MRFINQYRQVYTHAMASPVGEENLEDVLIDDFKGATLRLDPASTQPSRSVSPNCDASHGYRWIVYHRWPYTTGGSVYHSPLVDKCFTGDKIFRRRLHMVYMSMYHR